MLQYPERSKNYCCAWRVHHVRRVFGVGMMKNSPTSVGEAVRMSIRPLRNKPEDAAF
jgi:hypothetical protein